MSYKRKLPTTNTRGVEVWTYWVSRDSLAGDLSGLCSLWCAKPLRCSSRTRVTWVGADARYQTHLGTFTPANVQLWFGTYPETDLELIRVEQTATERMLAEANKQAK